MNNVNVRLGEVAISGNVQGLWNKDTKSFDVKRGQTKNEKRYQIFQIKVSDKDQDGNWTNGKGLDVMLWGNTKVEHGDAIAIKGRLKPNNYTNKEGKEIYGLQFVAFDTDMFEANGYEKKEVKDEVEEDNPWDA